MSIQTFKKKGVINYGSNKSGKPPGGIWIRQGPFGNSPLFSLASPCSTGFSINGGTRNVGYIGKSSAFSKTGTPFKGEYPKGYGGCCGTYKNSEPVMNFPEVRGITEGEQYKYIKPSVLSTYGMLHKKYKWIYSGQYPNYWVQPQSANDNMSHNGSQQLYIQTKAAANDCVVDVNASEKYVDHKICGPPLGCNAVTNTATATIAKRKGFNSLTSFRGYTKNLYQPQTSSQHTLRIQRKCSNPIGPQKPFPFASNGGNNFTKGIHYEPPPISQIYYKNPPEWYWSTA